MNKGLVILGAVAVLGVGVYLAGTDVDIDGQVKLPDVDVTAKGGELPNVDVNTPEISVGEKKVDVTLPEVDVSTQEKTVSIPTIDYNAAEDSVIDEANESDSVENE